MFLIRFNALGGITSDGHELVAFHSGFFLWLQWLPGRSEVTVISASSRRAALGIPPPPFPQRQICQKCIKPQATGFGKNPVTLKKLRYY